MQLYWCRLNQRVIEEYQDRIHKLDCPCEQGFLGSGVIAGGNKLRELNVQVHQILKDMNISYS